MTTMTQAVTRSARTRSNFGNKARRFKNLLQDKKILTRAHQQLCMSTHALFLAAYDEDEDGERQYQIWQAHVRAVVKNKRIAERGERDKVASELLPLQVRAYILVRLAV